MTDKSPSWIWLLDTFSGAVSLLANLIFLYQFIASQPSGAVNIAPSPNLQLPSLPYPSFNEDTPIELRLIAAMFVCFAHSWFLSYICVRLFRMFDVAALLLGAMMLFVVAIAVCYTIFHIGFLARVPDQLALSQGFPSLFNTIALGYIVFLGCSASHAIRLGPLTNPNHIDLSFLALWGYLVIGLMSFSFIYSRLLIG